MVAAAVQTLPYLEEELVVLTLEHRLERDLLEPLEEEQALALQEETEEIHSLVELVLVDIRRATRRLLILALEAVELVRPMEHLPMLETVAALVDLFGLELMVHRQHTVMELGQQAPLEPLEVVLTLPLEEPEPLVS
jgi:hypothetical protein